MKLSYFIAVLICIIKTTLAGIEIPRDGCEWFSGTLYGIDIKCDGKAFEKFHNSSQFDSCMINVLLIVQTLSSD